ncbi:MAG: S9 family peptidase [Phycisphaerales bacterium]|nr:S9 family peptidase [Phycisphaerales bacterium]
MNSNRKLTKAVLMPTIAVCACSIGWMSVASESLADAPVRDHDIVAEDYFSLAVVTSCAMSPDGEYVAYTDMRWEPPEETRNTDLWVVSTRTREPVRLTFERSNEGSPQWSPDGRWIYYTSNAKRAGEEKPPYDGKTQVWRIGVDGRDSRAITRVADGVGQYELAHDGKSLYYTTGKKNYDDDDWKSLREEFDSLTYGHGVVKTSQVWKLDLTTWRDEKLVDEKRVIGELAVSPDGRWLAMLTTPTEDLITNEGWSRVDLYDAKTKKIVSPPDKQWRADAPSPYGWLLGLAWSSNSRHFSFRVDFDGYPGEVFIATMGDDGPTGTHRLTRADEVYIAGDMMWHQGTDDFCFAAEDHARRRVYCVKDAGEEKQGQTVTLTPGDVVVQAFSLARSGDAAAAVISTITHPPDVFAATIAKTAGVAGASAGDTIGKPGPFERLTSVNPQVDAWKLPTIETVSWTSPDGTKVEGIMELPPDHEPGAKLPLIVEIHGGPTAASMLEMQFWIYGRVLMPARGWALLSANYRGSTGFGDKFLTELIGHKNDRDVADILSGVDALVERGIADPDKMAVMGWSNGGYLTNCLITRTDRFKAASSGAGVFDEFLQWLAEDTPGHVINFQQGFPWNAAEQMMKASALYNVDKVKTPTLIHVGESDPRCPPEHSRGLFRALHHYVKVPAELVVYPGEGHGLTKYTHRKAKMEWDVKWFDHHVLGKTDATEDASTDGAKPASGVD